mgnify:CR=1 FL=1
MTTAHVHYTVRITSGPREGEVFETTVPEVAREEDIYYPERDYAPERVDLDDAEGVTEHVLRDAIQDLEQDEETTVELSPEDAFGERSEEKVVRRHVDAIAGEVAEDELVESEDGHVGWIVAVEDEEAVVDFNHELAGEHVAFEIRLVDLD